MAKLRAAQPGTAAGMGEVLSAAYFAGLLNPITHPRGEQYQLSDTGELLILADSGCFTPVRGTDGQRVTVAHAQAAAAALGAHPDVLAAPVFADYGDPRAAWQAYKDARAAWEAGVFPDTNIDDALAEHRQPSADEVLTTVHEEITELTLILDNADTTAYRDQIDPADAARVEVVLNTLAGFEWLLDLARGDTLAATAAFVEDFMWPAHHLVEGAAYYLGQDVPAAIATTADKEELAAIEHVRSLTGQLAAALASLSGHDGTAR